MNPEIKHMSALLLVDLVGRHLVVGVEGGHQRLPRLHGLDVFKLDFMLDIGGGSCCQGQAGMGTGV